MTDWFHSPHLFQHISDNICELRVSCPVPSHPSSDFIGDPLIRLHSIRYKSYKTLSPGTTLQDLDVVKPDLPRTSSFPGPCSLLGTSLHDLPWPPTVWFPQTSVLTLTRSHEHQHDSSHVIYPTVYTSSNSPPVPKHQHYVESSVTDPCKRIHTQNPGSTVWWRHQEHVSQIPFPSNGNNDRDVTHPESDLRHQRIFLRGPTPSFQEHILTHHTRKHLDY
jgi:hypothetical protein